MSWNGALCFLHPLPHYPQSPEFITTCFLFLLFHWNCSDKGHEWPEIVHSHLQFSIFIFPHSSAAYSGVNNSLLDILFCHLPRESFFSLSGYSFVIFLWFPFFPSTPKCVVSPGVSSFAPGTSYNTQFSRTVITILHFIHEQMFSKLCDHIADKRIVSIVTTQWKKRSHPILNERSVWIDISTKKMHKGSHEKTLSVISHQRNVNQNTVWYYPIPVRMAMIKKDRK